MGFYGSTIQEMAANKLSRPYYRFDGTTAHNHIAVANDDKIDLYQSDFSFECWFMPNESGRLQRLAKLYDATGWIIEQDANNKISFCKKSADVIKIGAKTRGNTQKSAFLRVIRKRTQNLNHSSKINV